MPNNQNFSDQQESNKNNQTNNNKIQSWLAKYCSPLTNLLQHIFTTIKQEYRTLSAGMQNLESVEKIIDANLKAILVHMRRGEFFDVKFRIKFIRFINKIRCKYKKQDISILDSAGSFISKCQAVLSYFDNHTSIAELMYLLHDNDECNNEPLVKSLYTDSAKKETISTLEGHKLEPKTLQEVRTCLVHHLDILKITPGYDSFDNFITEIQDLDGHIQKDSGILLPDNAEEAEIYSRTSDIMQKPLKVLDRYMWLFVQPEALESAQSSSKISAGVKNTNNVPIDANLTDASQDSEWRQIQDALAKIDKAQMLEAYLQWILVKTKEMEHEDSDQDININSGKLNIEIYGLAPKGKYEYNAMINRSGVVVKSNPSQLNILTEQDFAYQIKFEVVSTKNSMSLIKLVVSPI